MRTRSPLLKPADNKELPQAEINRGRSSGPITELVAASIRQELAPRRRTIRPAKFPSAVAVTLDSLGQLRLDDAHDLAHILHFHHLIDIQADFEGLLQITG